MSKVSGIYLITCRPDGGLPYYYVGQSIDIGRRKQSHFQRLKTGKHYNKFVQRCFHKYGETAFTFEVLETCERSDLDDREGWWLSEMVGAKRCLNLSRDATAPFRGKRLSDEHRKSISRGGKGLVRSEETRRAISAANAGEKNSMFGKVGKLSQRSKPVVGKSVETGDIVRFESMQIAVRAGFAQESISKCCSGKNKVHKGYRWMLDYGPHDPFPPPRIKEKSIRTEEERIRIRQDGCRKISESKRGNKNYFFGKSGSSSPVAKAVVGTNLTTGETVSFKCIADSRTCGFVPSKISDVCRGNREHHKGYSWKYA